jgi:4-diphosphocytidyl-2-C-methyl-D-erythritol kinase
MLSERHAGAIVIRAPAKLNLYLEVLHRRPDGYHAIDTLMVGVSLYDRLTFQEEKSRKIVLDSDHPTLSTGPDNLICRAATLLQQRTGYQHGARIRLRKRIPLAAGLAGGSTDAAAALLGLNRLWRTGWTAPELAALGAELGSDVPFFFYTPAAWCTGRGEQVEPLPLGRRLWFVLACPPVGLATADVYRCLVPPASPRSGADIRQAVTAGDVEAIGQALWNRLEEAAFTLCPAVARLRERLQRLQPAGQLMSGSGSSVFALCRDQEEASRIAHQLRHGPDEGICPSVFLVRSCS